MNLKIRHYIYDTLPDLDSIQWIYVQKNKVWIHDMLHVSFNLKLNGESVYRLIND